MDVSENSGTPKSVFHYKPSILGYAYYSWKHPYIPPGSLAQLPCVCLSWARSHPLGVCAIYFHYGVIWDGHLTEKKWQESFLYPMGIWAEGTKFLRNREAMGVLELSTSKGGFSSSLQSHQWNADKGRKKTTISHAGTIKELLACRTRCKLSPRNLVNGS